MQVPKPRGRCTKHKDGDGVHFIVASEFYKTGNSPSVDVWWNRGPQKRIGGDSKSWSPRTEIAEELVIRQENGRVGADVLILTPGQAYDLLAAISGALENP